MDITTEHLKLKLIETQMALLQYQHRDVSAGIAQIKAGQAQAAFDAAVDARNMPSGATKPPDEYAGS